MTQIKQIAQINPAPPEPSKSLPATNPSSGLDVMVSFFIVFASAWGAALWMLNPKKEHPKSQVHRTTFLVITVNFSAIITILNAPLIL